MASLPAGYWWSPKVKDPLPLQLCSREGHASLVPGLYDFATLPIGDNWTVAKDGAYTSIKLNSVSGIGIMPRFPVKEPSSGFLMVKRGPYASADVQEKDRGAWEISCLPGGMVYRRASIPAYGHSGARYDRWNTNGYLWGGEGYYPTLDTPYWGTGKALGPKKFGKKSRVEIQPSQVGPDLTILSCIPNVTIYMSIRSGRD